ncbi:MAG: GAF domain-containing protein [Chloroflexota bacterium]
MTPMVERPAETAVLPDKKMSEESRLVQQALDKQVRDSLRLVSLGGALVFTLLAVAHMVLLPPNIARIMIPMAAGTAVMLFAFRFVLAHWKPPAILAHPVAVGILSLFSINSLLHLYLTNEPRQTTNVLLVIMATGLFLLSDRWFFAVEVGNMLAWLLVVLQLPASSEWVHYALALLMGLVVAGITFRLRQRVLVRFVRLRFQDQAQQEMLVHRARQLETSMELGKRITAILNMSELLDEVVELIRQKYQLRFVAVFLLNDVGDQAQLRAGTGREGALLCYEKFELQANEATLVGAVAKNGRCLWLNNTNEPSQYAPLNVIAGAKAELALPLQISGVRLGVLDLQSDQTNAFAVADIPFLEMLADQIAVAVYNAYVYQGEQSTRLLTEKMYMTGRALSGTLDRTELLDRVLENLSHVVSSHRTAILLNTDGALMIVADLGFPDSGNVDALRIPIDLSEDNSVYGWIYRHKRPLAIPDVTQRSDWHQVDNMAPTRAWLGVPLLRGNEVVGILSLARATLQSYTDEEIRLATAFAEQASTALHNANLYDKLSRFNQQLEQQVKHRTADLRDAVDRLEKLDRTKSDFISVAAHELRTPLTLLRGYSQMLLRDEAIANNDFHREMVTNIQAGEARLEKVVNAMVDMAKIDNRALDLYPEPVSIPDILQRVMAEWRVPLRERQLQLDVLDMSDLPALEADPDALVKVFSHVIGNAIKYTPDGGIITVWGTPQMAANGTGNYVQRVELVIRDSGIGIDPAYHDLIFTKFYQTGEVTFHSTGQTKFKGGGPGLGLPIARGIVEAHQGKIWVESRGYDEKKLPGSEFHVLLPVKQSRDLTPVAA